MKRTLTASIIVAACVGLDQATKHLAVLELKDSAPISLWNATVRLLYAENTGAWGSLGDSWPPVVRYVALVGMPLLVLGLIGFGLVRRATISRAELVGYSLVLGGGIGNIIDRLLHGYVVDFLYVGFGRFATNIFNIADMAIVTGVGLLVLAHFYGPRTAPPQASITR